MPNQLPRKKKKDDWKIHDTGCARTEGYYKVDSKQKANHKVIIYYYYAFQYRNVQIFLWLKIVFIN